MGKFDYGYSVFINCPFDREYKNIFDAIVFTVFDCGFIARSAKEQSDSDQVRIEKIYNIIYECKYGIHDISRVELDATTNLPRFNMPLELGIFLGAKRFGDRKQKEKRCLILDREQYRYQKFISDIAGQDIFAHHNDPFKAIACVRNWLFDKSKRKSIPSAKLICDHYKAFTDDLPRVADAVGTEPDKIIYNEYVILLTEWLKKYG